MSETLNYLLQNEEQFRRARIPALYADFRPLQTTNPDGYNANIDAWRKGLANAAAAGALPSHDQLLLMVDRELLRALDTKEWGQPLALPTVVHEAIQKGDMMPLHQFMAAKESIIPTAGSWRSLPWKVVGWGLRQVGLVGAAKADDKLPTEKMVLLGNVERASEKVAKKANEHLTRAERIYSKTRFAHEFAHALGEQHALSDQDVEVLLKYLVRDKKLAAYNGETVKLRAPQEEVENLYISQEDSTIASLVTLMEDLNVQIDRISTRVDDLTSTAREAVSKKNKVSALAALKSKKLAEATLAKRTATRSQLEEVYASIEQAQDQIELVRVMGDSAAALRSLNKQVGGAEGVDDVVDQLREEMGTVNEIGEVIADVGRDAVPIDEDEVDAELAALEQVETDKERQKELERERERDLETARRLQELQEVERVAREEAAERKASEREEDALRGLKRMSIDERTEAEPAV